MPVCLEERHLWRFEGPHVRQHSAELRAIPGLISANASAAELSLVRCLHA